MIKQSLLITLALVLSMFASGALECSVHDDAKAQHGRELYATTCAVCHGTRGEGYRADNAPALANPYFLASVSDSFLFSAISNGRANTTMSAWSKERGGPLSRADVESIVAFLHTWDTLPRVTLDERPTFGDAKRGGEVFTRECVRCHGVRGTGGPNVHVGDTELLQSTTNGFLRYAIEHGRPGTAMPAFDLALGDKGTDDVITALRDWQRYGALGDPRPQPAKPPPLPLGPVPLNPRGPEPVGFKPFPGATPADAIKTQLDRNAKMALLDARAPGDYMNEHIAGAVSVPFYDPDPYVADLPRDAWIVAYCACPHAESGMLAQKLVGKGFTKVTVLDEGLGVWRSRGYPTHKGEKP